MLHVPQEWQSRATRLLATELLDNAEYFSDVQNGYYGLDGGYEGEEMKGVVRDLTDLYYSEEIDLSLVHWAQLAEVVNANIEDREVNDEYRKASDRAGA